MNVRPPYPSWDSHSRNSMTHTVAQITSIGVEDQAGPSKRRPHRLNVSSMSPIHLNINTPALCDAPQMETKSADVLPSDNLQDNADMHSSYATDDTAAEIDVVPEDDNDGGSEKDMDTEDDEHLDGGQQPVGGKESTPHIPEGYTEPCNPAQECSVVDTLIPDPDQIGDEHVESSLRDMWKGRRFPDRESFRTTLKKFAIYNNFALKPIKTSRMEVTARCGDPNCPWRIHASIVESGPQFQVKTYKQNHSCSKPTMGLAHRQATSELVAEFIKDWVRLHPNYTPKKIISDFQLEFGVVVSYRKAWMAKEIAMHDIRGSYEESFKILPDYCLELQRTSPGTITHLLKEDDNSFSKIFWAFGSSIQSFCSSLRPLIAVDGAQLRGKYPGVLFCAMTYDGDHRLFPLAFAIVESKDQETWEWFLAAVDNALGPVQNLTIVTGQQENLISAVQQKLPNASHCYCVRHISQNLHSVFKDDGIVAKFWNAARAYKPFEYERHMNDIRNISEEAHTWIEEIGKQYWANAFVEGRRYDMLTTNIDEFTNSLLKDVKELPITKQVEAVRSKLMEISESRRHSSQMMQTMVTPYAERVLNAEAEHASQLGACADSQFEFQIHSAESVDVVHLDRRSCSCRKWNILGIPCSHAVAAIKLKGLEPYDFCEHWFSTETYRSTYNDIVHATRDMGQWEKSGMQVLPPRMRRPPGRPKTIKIHKEDGQRNPVTCSYCKQKGHNRKTCHNSPLSRLFN
eukprot:TRINITY_DN40300_c0_g1_i6.p1 TRINITY_DN40300_c0_g1~~TRINITY_DN40300_c0_g1_i6.p1  ORF type:complete len:742 (-),score=94.17 TRINITY_DN40300_c0_g1_i6:207-2432(-)